MLGKITRMNYKVKYRRTEKKRCTAMVYKWSISHVVDFNRIIKYNGQKESSALFIFRYGSVKKKQKTMHIILFITSDFKSLHCIYISKTIKKRKFPRVFCWSIQIKYYLQFPTSILKYLCIHN